jgi:hypothetical protein
MEGRALSHARLGPDAPAVPLHDLLANGQADTGAEHVLAVQTRENAEYLIRIFLVEPCPLSSKANSDSRPCFSAPM